MNENLRFTKDIHNFVRGKMNWEESLQLLDEIVDSEEWLNHLEIDMLLYKMACKKREMGDVKPPIPKYY